MSDMLLWTAAAINIIGAVAWAKAVHHQWSSRIEHEVDQEVIDMLIRDNAHLRKELKNALDRLRRLDAHAADVLARSETPPQ